MRATRTLEIGTGLFVLLGFAALFFLLTQLPANGIRLTGSTAGYHVTAEFDNVGDLKSGSPVTMAGVRVGEPRLAVLAQRDLATAGGPQPLLRPATRLLQVQLHHDLLAGARRSHDQGARVDRVLDWTLFYRNSLDQQSSQIRAHFKGIRDSSRSFELLGYGFVSVTGRRRDIGD